MILYMHGRGPAVNLDEVTAGSQNQDSSTKGPKPLAVGKTVPDSMDLFLTVFVVTGFSFSHDPVKFLFKKIKI